MMFSNNPIALRDQDFHSKRADMIEAARAEQDSHDSLGDAIDFCELLVFSDALADKLGAELAAAKAEIERLKAAVPRKMTITSRAPTEADMVALGQGYKAAIQNQIGVSALNLPNYIDTSPLPLGKPLYV